MVCSWVLCTKLFDHGCRGHLLAPLVLDPILRFKHAFFCFHNAAKTWKLPPKHLITKLGTYEGIIACVHRDTKWCGYIAQPPQCRQAAQLQISSRDGAPADNAPNPWCSLMRHGKREDSQARKTINNLGPSSVVELHGRLSSVDPSRLLRLDKMSNDWWIHFSSARRWICGAY